MADTSSSDHRWGVSSPEVLHLVEGYLEDAANRTHARLGEVLGVAITTAVVGGDPVTAGASTARVAEVDRVQYSIGHGPCLAALAGSGEIYVPDLAADPRWQPYGRAAAELGARSSLSVPVVDPRLGTAGVVKVYTDRVDALDEEQRRTVRELALEVAGGMGLASTLVATSFELDDRIEAMDTRRTIDLATGVLMGRLGCTAEQAFAVLRRESQNQNAKLRDVAAGLLVRTAETDGAPPAAGVAQVAVADRAHADGRTARTTLQAPFSRRGETPVHGR